MALGILKRLDKLHTGFKLANMFITRDLATVKTLADAGVVMKYGMGGTQRSKAGIFAPPHAAHTRPLPSSVPVTDPGWLTGLLAAQAQ